jgi:hypothetical protein
MEHVLLVDSLGLEEDLKLNPSAALFGIEYSGHR